MMMMKKIKIVSENVVSNKVNLNYVTHENQLIIRN